MLKIRVIPTMLWKGFGLVKGEKFNSWRRVGTVLPSIRVYNQRDVDELILLDIEASNSQEEIDCETLSDYTSDCFVPLTVGGGINNIDIVQKLLRIGADKISINTAIYTKPDLVDQIAKKHGSQCIVASVDAKNENGKWICYSNSGTKRTEKNLIDLVRELEARGAGEILLTSIDKDGTMQGYDLEMISVVTQSVKIPVIASGGAGSYDDMIKAVKFSGASAVAAASMFHFTEKTPSEAKKAMSNAGIEVRRNLNEEY